VLTASFEPFFFSDQAEALGHYYPEVWTRGSEVGTLGAAVRRRSQSLGPYRHISRRRCEFRSEVDLMRAGEGSTCSSPCLYVPQASAQTQDVAGGAQRVRFNHHCGGPSKSSQKGFGGLGRLRMHARAPYSRSRTPSPSPHHPRYD
jgi:hypothetical protein